MAYRLFIFDFDGTLADSGPLMIKLMNKAARRFGFREVSDAEIEALRGQDNRAVIRALGVPMWRLPQIAHFMRQQAQANPSPPLFAGIPDMLARLNARGSSLAIVSSNSEPVVRRALGEHADLIHHFGCNASLFGKAAQFKAALKRSRLRRQDAIAIGDETRDLEAARKARIASGAVVWGYAAAAILAAQSPDHIFAAPADIEALA